jgi:hypothetical protein
MMFKFLDNTGCLIFNLGNNVNLKSIEDELKIFLKDKFKIIEVRPYGAFNNTSKKTTSPLLKIFNGFFNRCFSSFKNIFWISKK